MLGNGLGEALARELPQARRVLDLFAGSGSVAWHVSENYCLEVLASDLQHYSRVLSAAVIERTDRIDKQDWLERWFCRAEAQLGQLHNISDLRSIQNSLAREPICEVAQKARDIAQETDYSICAAYGGYYYSPLQAVWISSLRLSLPRRRPYRDLALASLIQAASRCSASPGHTAQPLKPNETAGKFVAAAWRRDLLPVVRSCANDISRRHATVQGKAYCASAEALAKRAEPGDLAFVDPPYSGVQYSRFYHVLETIARGTIDEVFGSGRYPPPDERPASDFSKVTTSRKALGRLLEILSNNGASAIVTFPAGTASNGLSGDMVKEVASNYFRIKEEKVTSRFSTLGGSSKNRSARKDTEELILTLSI